MIDKQKLANLKMLQQKKQQLDRQKLQMQKSDKLPLEASYKPDGDLVTELNKSDYLNDNSPSESDAQFAYSFKDNKRRVKDNKKDVKRLTTLARLERHAAGQKKNPAMYNSFEPEGEVIDERRREDKGTPRRPEPSAAFKVVSKMMGSGRLGVQPRGVKKDKGAPTPGPSATPAQKVAKRRADAQRAQDMMHSRYD